MLSDRLLGAAEHAAPRPAGDFSAHPLAAELDELCAEHGFGRLDELTYGEVEGLVGALDAFERDVSARRRILHDELDVLTEALVGRLQDAAGPAEEDSMTQSGDSSRFADVGEFIRNQREVASMSVRRLADLAGVSNPYLSQIERGLRRPSAEVLQPAGERAADQRRDAVRAGRAAGRRDARRCRACREAIAADPPLTAEQKQALLNVYESFLLRQIG